MTSRKRILFGCYAMVLAIIGDYLLGFETFSMSDSEDAYMGMTANVAPDWRYHYDEGMVRRLIERITVFEDHLDFEFKCGLETEVKM